MRFTINTGKYKGKIGHFVCYIKPRTPSDERKIEISVQPINNG